MLSLDWFNPEPAMAWLSSDWGRYETTIKDHGFSIEPNSELAAVVHGAGIAGQRFLCLSIAHDSLPALDVLPILLQSSPYGQQAPLRVVLQIVSQADVPLDGIDLLDAGTGISSARFQAPLKDLFIERDSLSMVWSFAVARRETFRLRRTISSVSGLHRIKSAAANTAAALPVGAILDLNLGASINRTIEMSDYLVKAESVQLNRKLKLIKWPNASMLLSGTHVVAKELLLQRFVPSASEVGLESSPG